MTELIGTAIVRFLNRPTQQKKASAQMTVLIHGLAYLLVVALI